MKKIEAIDWQRTQVIRELERARRVVDNLEIRLGHLDSAKQHAMSNTPVFSDRNATCIRCGADVRTERLFSEHYIISDPNYYNLGHCPNKVLG